ncbi:DUF2332 domain-containing protein [Microbacterium sp. 2FI]|uniref:DUF2332 domain-containing protein n=1 Tax=Microbacterium sp. 2FI TaxID=2502193 RepID=UPI0010F4BC70|nr:DUF2332 domain-containing protein [Microbacterium sp. 2FI]
MASTASSHPGSPVPDDPLAATYDEFGRRWAHGTSPLYEDWATGIARDAEVLGLIRTLPAPKRQPNLVFAAARWEGAPLDPYPAWREWLTAHWTQVAETALERATQTNEVNRCATLMPVMSQIDGPVALLEVGTAAGLCLYPDRYAYRYDSPGGERTLAPTGATAAVTLACRLDDADSAPTRLPDVAWRAGIDLAPIDAGDADAVAWLETLIWPGPDHDARRARLRGAASLAAADPPRIVRGDLLERLEPLAADAPAEATLVVFHSAVLLYLDAAQRRRFADVIAALGTRTGRRVVWLSNETLGTLPEIDARVPADLDTHHRFVQTVDGVPVALANQHGATYETVPFRT